MFKLLESFRATYADYVFNFTKLEFIIECIYVTLYFKWPNSVSFSPNREDKPNLCSNSEPGTDRIDIVQVSL